MIIYTKPYRLIYIAALVSGILLRIVPIWTRQTWYDENFTIILARLPLPELLAATAADVHPPLWYLICWLFARFDLSGWAIVRIPALIASLASIYIFWLILRESWYYAPKWILAAFTVFCIMPTQIYYAQEGRQYALLTLLVLLAWIFILRIKRFSQDYYPLLPENNKFIFKYLIGLSVVFTSMLYLHNYGIIYAAVILAAGLLFIRHGKNYLLLVFSMALFLYIPWIRILLTQMDSIHGVYWMVYLSPQSFLTDLAESFYSSETSLNNRILDLAVFWFFMGWNIYAIIKEKYYNYRIYGPLLILSFGPAVTALAISIFWNQPILLNRALVPSAAFMAILITYKIPSLTMSKIKSIAACIIFIPATIVNLGITANRYIWPLWDSAKINIIAENWRPGDMIYYNDDSVFVSGIAWQTLTTEMDILRIQPCGSTRGGLTESTRAAIGLTSGLLPSAKESDRIWIVLMESPLNPSCEIDYFRSLGLLDNNPVLCSYDNELVKACVYLVDNHGN